MKLIQINKGISIRKDCIEAVEEQPDSKSKIYTKSGNIFDCKHSYSTIVMILEIDKTEERTNELLQKILNNQQVNVA